jgi:hypothetical protein
MTTTAAQIERLKYRPHRVRDSITVPQRDRTQAEVRPERNHLAPVNPALVALVDHLAAELAREYICLMEEAVRDSLVLPIVKTREEG